MRWGGTRSGGVRSISTTREAAEAPPEPSVVPVRRDRGATFVVRARWEEDRSPAAGVWLDLALEGEAGTTVLRRSLATGATGEARFEELPPGWVTVELPRTGQQLLLLELRPGATRVERVALRPGIDVGGVVLDPRGAPVAGATVSFCLGMYSWRAYPVAVTDGHGRFRVRGFSAVQAPWLGAAAPGFGPSPYLSLGESPGDEVRLRPVLAPAGGLLAGRVLDGDAEPVAGALVRVGAEKAWHHVDVPGAGLAYGGGPRVTVTDVGGRFSILGAPPGLQPLVVEAAGHTPHLGEVRVAAGEAPPLLVRMEPSAVLHGRVTDARGRPARKVLVEALAEGLSHHPRDWTGANGRYELAGLPAGEVLVRVHAEDVAAVERSFSIEAGAAQRWDVQLVPSLALTGSVGEPVAGVFISAWDEREDVPASHWAGTHTDAAGAFALLDLVYAPYTLRAELPGGEPLVARGVFPGDHAVLEADGESDGEAEDSVGVTRHDLTRRLFGR